MFNSFLSCPGGRVPGQPYAWVGAIRARLAGYSVRLAGSGRLNTAHFLTLIPSRLHSNFAVSSPPSRMWMISSLHQCSLVFSLQIPGGYCDLTLPPGQSQSVTCFHLAIVLPCILSVEALFPRLPIPHPLIFNHPNHRNIVFLQKLTAPRQAVGADEPHPGSVVAGQNPPIMLFRYFIHN